MSNKGLQRKKLGSDARFTVAQGRVRDSVVLRGSWTCC